MDASSAARASAEASYSLAVALRNKHVAFTCAYPSIAGDPHSRVRVVVVSVEIAGSSIRGATVFTFVFAFVGFSPSTVCAARSKTTSIDDDDDDANRAFNPSDATFSAKTKANPYRIVFDDDDVDAFPPRGCC
jgi:hypothetical protein